MSEQEVARKAKPGGHPQDPPNPLRFLEKIARNHGGFAPINMGMSAAAFCLVSDPALIKEVLVEHYQKYKHSTGYQQIRAVIGEGLLLSEGATWKQQRTLAQPHFSPSTLNGQLDWMSKLVADCLDAWQPYAETPAPVDLSHQFNLLTQRLAGVWVMGRGFQKRAETMAEIYGHIQKILFARDTSAEQSANAQGMEEAINLEQAVARLDQCVYELLDEYPEIMHDDVGFLKHLLADGDPETLIRENRRSLRDQIMTLFFTAADTTAASLCWTTYVLDKYSEVKQRIHEEVNAVLGKQNPTPELLKRMEYTEKVIKESLRLYPPVPSFSRIALEDHLIGSHPVSRNMTLIISPYVTHRLAQHWDNPYEFDPDRFGKERSDGRSPFAYIPFAAGPRSCIGSNLALMVSKLVIALIMQRYDLTLVPGQSMEPQISTVMWPKYGMNVNVNRLARLNPDSAFTSNEVSMSDKTPSSAL